MNLPDSDVKLIEKIKRAKALRDAYLPRRLTDEEFVELRKLEQELDPIDTKQFLLDVISRQELALELCRKQRDSSLVINDEFCARQKWRDDQIQSILEGGGE